MWGKYLYVVTPSVYTRGETYVGMGTLLLNCLVALAGGSSRRRGLVVVKYY
jgi:hypothetical protein